MQALEPRVNHCKAVNPMVVQPCLCHLYLPLCSPEAQQTSLLLLAEVPSLTASSAPKSLMQIPKCLIGREQSFGSTLQRLFFRYVAVEVMEKSGHCKWVQQTVPLVQPNSAFHLCLVTLTKCIWSQKGFCSEFYSNSSTSFLQTKMSYHQLKKKRSGHSTN